VIAQRRHPADVLQAAADVKRYVSNRRYTVLSVPTKSAILRIVTDVRSQALAVSVGYWPAWTEMYARYYDEAT